MIKLQGAINGETTTILMLQYTQRLISIFESLTKQLNTKTDETNHQ